MVNAFTHDGQLTVQIIQHQPNQQQTNKPEHKHVSFKVSDYGQILSPRVITAKSKTTRTEHVGDYYKGNSFITRGIWL